jgi:short-subunit dehydrogenase
MLKKLEGKIAVITGGTEGMGLAAAKLFVREGAYVFITGRRQKELDEAVQAIGTNVSGVQGDVAKLAGLDRLYETVSKNTRPVDSVRLSRCFEVLSSFPNLSQKSNKSISRCGKGGDVVNASAFVGTNPTDGYNFRLALIRVESVASRSF